MLLGEDDGRDVGLVGPEVGMAEGTDDGLDVGRALGILVGRLEDGTAVGLLVSPGFVGREVTGDRVGVDVGILLVGMEVGAAIKIVCPIVTEVVLTE